MKSKLGLWLLIIPLLLVGCKTKTNKGGIPAARRIDHKKPLSWGQGHNIYAFADAQVWKYAEVPLRNSIERYFYTTENESLFELKKADYNALDQFYKFRNLIFLGHLESNDEVSKFLQESLVDSAIEELKVNKVGMYVRQNLWANDQIVIFLLGVDEESLLKYNMLQAGDIFEHFRKVYYERAKDKVYGFDVYPKTFFNDYPWEIKMPKDYVVYKNEVEKRYLSFISRKKDKPDMYVTVYFEDMELDEVSYNWAMETRIRLAWEVYDEDEISRENTRSERVTFGQRNVVKLSGKWQNSKYAVGGAFQSFAFYDEKSKRAYLVDNSVFFPEGYKLPALIELEIVSRTIEVN
ncbi:MAG: DUF4837 family protein [Candidatus Cloacimonas sp.]|nr:DUF4837 family protein [Candidatus Cloacimonadota bacterium]